MSQGNLYLSQENLSLGFPIRSFTNWAFQPQMMARFEISDLESTCISKKIALSLYRVNKSTDQLHGYCTVAHSQWLTL